MSKIVSSFTYKSRIPINPDTALYALSRRRYSVKVVFVRLITTVETFATYSVIYFATKRVYLDAGRTLPVWARTV